MPKERLTKRQLEAFDRDQDERLLTKQERALREFDRVFRGYISRIESALRGRTFTDEQLKNLREATELTQDLYAYLEEAGLDEFMADYKSRYVDLTDQALEYFRYLEVDDTLRGASQEALDFLINRNVSELYESIDDRLVRPLDDVLVQQVVSNRSREEIINNVLTTVDNLSVGRTETIVFDSYARYHRAVGEEKAAELNMDIRWYIGPADKKTSEQCNWLLKQAPHGVPGMYYKDEIRAGMHSLLREDPLIVGGHYNCRHRFWAITPELAKKEGFKP